jgi:hypothetical protein
MPDTHLLLIGTKKGVFIGRAAAAQRAPSAWKFSGPHCSGTWSFCDVTYDPDTETIYGGGQSNWYGAAVWRSPDLGATWDHSSEGLSYPDGPGIEQVWRVRRIGETLYAGVDPAGLFRSEDGGRTWAEVTALRQTGRVDGWRETNGGLPLHAILPHRQDGGTKTDGPSDRDAPLLVAISAGGVYRGTPGGRTGSTDSTGSTRQNGHTGESWRWERTPAAGDACVHALVRTADGALYQQSHAGVWRSKDGGASWSDVSEGLPSRFGFPLVAHPHHPGTVYAVPLQSGIEGGRYVSDDGLAVWRTRDAGGSWERLSNGLPQGRTFLTVLRGALATDSLEPAGVFAGTPTGQVYGSADGGDTWFEVTRGLPPIYSVSCAVV